MILAFDSELSGWRPIGAALQNHCVGACDLCGCGRRDRCRSSADQCRLVDYFDNGLSKRGDTDWLFSWNVDPIWPRCAPGTQVILLF